MLSNCEKKNVLPAVKKKLLLAAMISSSLFCSHAFAAIDCEAPDKDRKYVKLLKPEGNWLYDKVVECGNNKLGVLQTQIEDEVNKFFGEQVVPELSAVVEEVFGEQVGDLLSGLIGVGPWLSFVGILAGSNSGPSESQIMLQVLLEAIQLNQDAIVEAVEEGFQDETEAQLNAVVLQASIFNARNFDLQASEYDELARLSYFAAEVKKRLEQKGERGVDNSHLYILITSLHAEIEKQYTKYAVQRTYPTLSSEAQENIFNEEYKSVLRVIANDSLKHVVTGSIGEMEVWEKAYDASFNYTTEYVGEGVGSGVYIFAYGMNDQPVEFTVKRGGCRSLGASVRAGMGRTLTIYDPLGRYYDEFIQRGCAVEPKEWVAKIEPRVPEMIDAHKKDPESFDRYVLNGYGPLGDILDSWWLGFEGASRSLSELDVYIQNEIPDTYPSSCTTSGNANKLSAQTKTGRGSGTVTYVHSGARSINIDCYPCGVQEKTVVDKKRGRLTYCAATDRVSEI